jgi:hypothetical protein
MRKNKKAMNIFNKLSGKLHAMGDKMMMRRITNAYIHSGRIANSAGRGFAGSAAGREQGAPVLARQIAGQGHANTVSGAILHRANDAAADTKIGDRRSGA